MANILITGVGSPGTYGVIDALSMDNVTHNLFGVDCVPLTAGKSFVLDFDVVPKATQKNEVIFIEKFIRLVEAWEIDVIIPQVSAELHLFAKNKQYFDGRNCRILIQDEEIIDTLDNKYTLFERLRLGTTMKRGCVSVDPIFREFLPKYKLVSNFIDLKTTCEEFGYPEKDVVVKLPVSNGSRGFRIISAHPYGSGDFYNKPFGEKIRLCDFVHILDNTIPELLVTEYLPGKEYSVDCMAVNGKPQLIFPRIREKIVNGISFRSVGIEHNTIIYYCERMIEFFKMKHMFGFQFKEDGKGNPKLIECNPRTQGTMMLGAHSNANVILGAVRSVLGRKVCMEQRDIIFNKRIDRYWGGVVA